MKTVTLLLALSISLVSFAQKAELNNESFDFWVGRWNAEWKQADGSLGSGTNKIHKVLDGVVLEENFEVISGNQAGYKGKSLSVFNPNTMVWHQVWVDNQNGHINFIGKIEGNRKMFQTLPVEKDGTISFQRMVFYDIEPNSFSWDWEGTNDGGKTWSLLWRINYTRVE